MSVYELNPLSDARWAAFLDSQPQASVFHSAAWLRALYRTYGYEPIVYTTASPSQELTDALVFCRVKSWLTGSRLVSVPFSDHCQPLVNASGAMDELLGSLEKLLERSRWKYAEFRLLSNVEAIFQSRSNMEPCEIYNLQTLDLRPSLDSLFHGFHKSCVQRKIHRAERERLTYETGRSNGLLKKFYRLLILTRRRHGIPPQPLAWFKNLIEALGDKVTIRVASKGDRPIASIVTISSNRSLIYKYGCSDAQYNNLGGTPFLFWKAIQDGKRQGALVYDLGRSEPQNEGLVGFKENWGTTSTLLQYYRLSEPGKQASAYEWKSRIARRLFAKMPNTVLTATGRLLYRHIG